MDSISLVLIVVATINSALGLIVIFTEHSTTQTRLYSLNILSILVWVGSMVFFRTTDQVNILIWTKVLYISASIIASSFIYFTYNFPRKEVTLNRTKIFIMFCLNGILILLILFTKTIIKNAYTRTGLENTISFGSLYFLYSFYILSFFSYGFFRLYIKYKKIEDPMEKRQLYYLFLGYSLSGCISLISNLILPWMNNFSFNWAGQVSTVIMVIFASYATIKHRLFDIKAIVFELLVCVLCILALVKIVILNNDFGVWLEESFFVTTLIIGVLLIKGVLQEVKNREKIELLAEKLKNANSRLEELDKKKTDFVSFASHQLQGPLTLMKSYSSYILGKDLSKLPEFIQEAFTNVDKSTDSMIHLVRDYLNITRIEQDANIYNFSAHSLKDLLAQIIKDWRSRIENTGLTFYFEYNSNHTYDSKIDKEKLKEVVYNIIDNSLKYTASGFIKVKLQRSGEVLLISVNDTGMGIHNEIIPILFQKFIRSEDAQKANYLGTGLGLYVAKKIIEAHEGKIWAESDGPNKGATFYIELKAL